MNYTIDMMEKDISDIITELSDLRRRKGHDYSGPCGDTLDNLREFGTLGVVVRIGDKFKRLKHYWTGDRTLQVQDEKILDTINDLINYSLYLRIMLKQETAPPSKKQNTEKRCKTCLHRKVYNGAEPCRSCLAENDGEHTNWVTNGQETTK